MSILDSRFTTGQVVQATGVSNAVLQTWLRRNIVNADNIGGGGNPGSYRSFTFNTVIEIAVAKALIDAGIRNDAAFAAALTFAHAGNGPHPAADIPPRMPGMLFDDRTEAVRTVLCLASDSSFVLPHGMGRNIYAAAKHRAQHQPFTLFEVDDLFDQVNDILDLERGAMMRAVYPLPVSPRGPQTLAGHPAEETA